MSKNTKKIIVTCRTAPNIALIKYWGKSNEELILPLNGSISITLDSDVLCTKTTLMLTLKNENATTTITFWLNNKKQVFQDHSLTELESSLKEDIINKKRFFTMLNKVRSNCSLENPHLYNINICSRNNFPTACGLASSASGFACLAQVLSIGFGYAGDVSELARLGSGSACRSCFGGFVKWSSGLTSDQSIAMKLFPSNHWEELNVLALVLEDRRKQVSSTHGMRDTVLTSELLQTRIKMVESKRLAEMETHIREKDFNNMAKLTISDSNNFHACCMDTYPPLFYLNDKSKEIINLVNKFNMFEAKTAELKAAYSFDAGPNAFIFVLNENLSDFLYLVYKIYFNDLTEAEFIEKKLVHNKSKDIRMEKARKELLARNFFDLIVTRTGDSEAILKYVIHSNVGQEAAILCDDLENSLLNEDGEPKLMC